MKSHISSQSGMSILESLLALGLVLGLAFTAGNYFYQQKSVLNFTSNAGTCRNVLEGQLSYLRQLGSVPAGVSWTHAPGSAGMGNASAFADPWLQDTFRYSSIQASPIFLGPAGLRTTVDNSSLSLGTIGTLNSLYNNVPTLCASGVNVATLPLKGGPFNPAVASSFNPAYDYAALSEFSTLMKVQAIDLRTGVASCPAAPLVIRPQGVQDSQTFKPHQMIASKPELGYRVTLVGNYKDTKGGNNTCEVTEDFTYPVDHSSQTLAVVQTASFLPVAGNANVVRPQCSHNPGMPSSLDLKLSVQPTNGTRIETGTVLLCADMSQQMNQNYCFDGGNSTPGAGMQGQPYNVDGLLRKDTVKWVPCSEVTACGLPPTSYTQTPHPTILGGVEYNLKYSGSAPGAARDGLWGCDIRIDVASVDLAGNFQVISKEEAGVTYLPFAKQYFPTTDCFACFQKKKRKWGAFIISVILFGPILSCLAGVGGVCKPRGMRFIGYNCRDISAGNTFCRKQPAKRPDWTPAPGGACMAVTRPFPNPYPGSYTFPETPSGGVYEEVILNPNGTYCEVSGLCDNTRWTGVPDEENLASPFATCGNIWTQYKIDISGLPQGTTAVPAGKAECILPVPDGSNLFLPNETAYSAFQVCAPSSFGTASVLCDPIQNQIDGSPIIYPMDPMTGTPNSTDPNRYLYFKREFNPAAGLPQCTK